MSRIETLTQCCYCKRPKDQVGFMVAMQDPETGKTWAFCSPVCGDAVAAMTPEELEQLDYTQESVN